MPLPIVRGDPTPEAVRKMMQGSGGTGTYFNMVHVFQPIAATSTANAATNWINPETGTIAAKTYVIFRVAGTGTIEAGRQSDGTGSASDLILAGTMTLGIHHFRGDQVMTGTQGATGSGATNGPVDSSWMLLGPGGTGTNNSIVMKHSDTITSTAKGGLVIEYFLLDA